MRTVSRAEAMKESQHAQRQITAATRRLLRRHGMEASEPEIYLRGAVAVLRSANIPVRELNVSPAWLLASGHMSLGELGAITAEIGQMTLEEQAEEVPEDFWDGEGYMPEDWWEDEDEWGPEIDEEDFDPWAKEPEPEPDGWVAPAPVPIRPNRWDLSTKPARYQVVWGDTLAGLAATYLHDGGRWREIWNLQPGEYTTTRTPDAIFVNDWLNMPQEAVDTLKAHTKKTGEKIPGETDWTPWIVGGALLVAAGGAAYAFSR